MIKCCLNIRRTESGDLLKLAALEVRAFEVGPYSKSMLKRMLDVPGSFHFVAEEDGKILGYVSAIPIDEKTADVESIAVDPSYQGKGIGAALLQEIEGEMKSRGFNRSILEVRDKNESSIGFYRKNGYTVIKHLSSYYHELYMGSRGAYRMQKIL